MRACFFVFLTIIIVLATESISWKEWKTKYNKRYASVKEEKLRHSIFLKNTKFIREHNKNYINGKHSYYVGLNQYADMSNQEFTSSYTTTIKRYNIPHSEDSHPAELPKSVNWVKRGYVTPVQNQGECGNSLVFSELGALEGAFYKFTNETKLIELSTSQIEECDSKNPCAGSLLNNIFEYIKQVGGIASASNYNFSKCNNNPKLFVADVKNIYKVEPNEAALQAKSAYVGPISIVVDASHSSFQFYAGGVYYQPNCSQYDLDLAVLLVGYGVYKTEDYWLVKNSWGVDWGLKGYIMMARNRNNNCGVATAASYPTACYPFCK